MTKTKTKFQPPRLKDLDSVAVPGGWASYEEFRNYVLREDLTDKQQENAWTTVDIDFVHQWFKDPRNKVTAEEKMAYYGERNRNRNELNRITNNKSKIQPRVF